MSSLCINYELMFLYLSVSLNSWNHFMCLVAQLCLTLCDPMDYSPPGFSVHGIFQSKILERVAMPSSRGSSQPRDTTQVFCIAGRFFTTELSGKPPNQFLCLTNLSDQRLIAAISFLAHMWGLELKKPRDDQWHLPIMKMAPRAQILTCSHSESPNPMPL